METVLLYILGILIIFVGLVLSIGLHEVGHLVPAKLFGVRVGQYMVGFGPTIFSRKFGETEYGFKAMPLGGYISMSGMYPPAKTGGSARTASTGFFQTMVQDARTASADTVMVDEEHRTFYQLPVLKRVIIMIGGPIMNLLIGIVLYAVVLCGFGTAQASTTVGSVSECVISQTSTQTECTADAPAAPGAEAGLQPGDRIITINNTPITSWEQATDFIRESAGETLTIVIDRDGTERSLDATPLLTERYVYTDTNQLVEDSEGNPVTEEVGFLGIGAAFETVQQPLTAVLPAVGDNIASVANMILHLPERLIDIANAAFGPEERDPNGPISVVGVGRIAGEITSIDTIPVVDRASFLVNLLASLNIALFVFNLVPLMPLDGGHVAGALWEGIRRFFAKLFGRRDPGPVDTAKIIPLTLIIVVLLGSMTLLLVYADIVKPITVL